MKVLVCGVEVDAIAAAEAVEAVARAIAMRARGIALFSVNVDMLAKASKDPDFANLLGRGDLCLADGVPVLWMARGLGARLPERVAGSDLVPLVAARAAREGWRLFLLGGAPGVAERAAERLVREHPGLRIAGTLAPPFGFEGDPAERRRVREAIASARPEVVLVGLGAPKQERFIVEERDALPVRAWLAVGGTFDLLAGDRRRAPPALQRLGLEWAWRMAQDPVRLGRRYLWEDAAIVPAYARALLERWLK